MKKAMSAVLAASLMLVTAGCALETTLIKPSNSIIKNDIQLYINEHVDNAACIDNIEPDSDSIVDERYEAAYIAEYSDSKAQYTDRFNISYKINDGEWALDDLSLDESYAQRSKTTFHYDNTYSDITTSESESDSSENSGSSSSDNSESKKDESDFETDAGTPSPESFESEGIYNDPNESRSNWYKGYSGIIYNGAIQDYVIIASKLSDHECVIDGEYYLLPFKVSQFTENGWFLSRLFRTGDETLAANQTTYRMYEKDDIYIIVYITNLTDHELGINDCSVTGIKENRFGIATGNDFSLEGAKHEYTEKDIITILGEPDKITTADDLYNKTFFYNIGGEYYYEFKLRRVHYNDSYFIGDTMSMMYYPAYTYSQYE